MDVAKDFKCKVFWPSSIGVFGPTTPKVFTPQHCILEPSSSIFNWNFLTYKKSVYGVTKVTGELLCSYYHKKFNVDVRGLRYPGIISTETLPGGGTTDYAVAIFYDAIQHGKYECYLKEDTQLPMMYMSDALKASVDLMESESAARGICYNLAAWSFSPSQLSKLIEAHVPNFSISYKIDPIRQVSLFVFVC